MVYTPDHPRQHNGYVYEHWIIWEQAHNKPLPDGWVVHHLNGIRHDNRPENLAGMPNHKHHFILKAMGKRIQELEALLDGRK